MIVPNSLKIQATLKLEIKIVEKTNNQSCRIICLFVVSRYNFHCLKKLFIKLLVDKIKSIVALRILELSLIDSKNQSLCQNVTDIV